MEIMHQGFSQIWLQVGKVKLKKNPAKPAGTYCLDMVISGKHSFKFGKFDPFFFIKNIFWMSCTRFVLPLSTENLEKKKIKKSYLWHTKLENNNWIFAAKRLVTNNNWRLQHKNCRITKNCWTTHITTSDVTESHKLITFQKTLQASVRSSCTQLFISLFVYSSCTM